MAKRRRRWRFLKRSFSASSHGSSRSMPHPSLRTLRFPAAGVLFGSPRAPTACQRCCADTSVCLFPAQACVLRFPGFAATSPEPFSSPPGATFVADSIWFHKASRRGRGGRLARLPSLPRSEQFTNCSGGSARPALSGLLLPPPPDCLRGSGAFPQLTCLRVARCEKLETKWSLQTEGELSCTERKEIPLWDFIFFSPFFIQKIQRDSVFNANVGFKSFRFGLTLQKKKKTDRLSDMTQKNFFPLNSCCSFVKPKAGGLNSEGQLFHIHS